MTQFQTYRPKGISVIERDDPSVGNIIYDELGELVQARLNEAFKGVNHIEDTTEYAQGQPLAFSNIPRNLFRNQVLINETKGKVQLQTPFQMIQYWNLVKDPNTYADTNSVSVFPKEGPNETLRKRVLKILGISPKSLKVPIIVANLGVERADNDYGFTFTDSDFQVIPAPFLQQDGTYLFDKDKNTLVPDPNGVQIWTPSDQSGLRRAGRGGGDCLVFGDGVLLGSYGGGRVQFFYNPQGRENFGKRKKIKINL